MQENLCKALDAAGISYLKNEPLSAHCTFRIGGPADLFLLPETDDQLCTGIALCKEQGVRYYLLGNGSNILFEDAGFRGAVLDLTAMKTGIGMKENIPGEDPEAVYCSVTVGAGTKLSTLCNFALNHSCTGLEFAYGIPGTVGGAVYMNAGAYGGEMKDVLTSVEYLTAEGKTVEAPASALDLRYRHSIFEENGGCILWATFRLKKGDPAAIKARMDEMMQKPRGQAAAGQTQRRQHLQAAGGGVCRCPHRPVRPAGLPPRRGRCQREALRLCGQSGRCGLCGCAGLV